MKFQEMIKDFEDPARFMDSEDPYEEYLTNTEESLNFIGKCIEQIDDTDLQYSALMSLSSIFLNRRRTYSRSYDPNLDPRLVAFQEYMMTWNWLIAKVPGKETEDIKNSGLKLLQNMIQDNSIKNYKNNKEYQQLMEQYSELYKKLKNSGNYPQLNELMDG